MKKLLIVSLFAFAAGVLNAVQCEGVTKSGARCKREAAENSRFCIGHADQAKPAKAEKAKPAEPEAGPEPAEPKAERLKDDGTCWAVTEKGERCKHKKDGESDYCKQHAADRKPAKPADRCRAMKWDGSRCERAPLKDCYYCKQHAKLGKPDGADKQAAEAGK